ncbi:MAG TPA: hypothetical protein PKD72_14190 [Gemmatales bacterium]|nr:hypothetical protein [Gemmatales bacterium]
MSNEKPPATVSGKWIVIIMVPAILISFAWLAYARVNFTHPTALSTSLQSTSPVPTK